MRINFLNGLQNNTNIFFLGKSKEDKQNQKDLALRRSQMWLKLLLQKESSVKEKSTDSMSDSFFSTLTHNQADHKNDPTEHERDRLLGTKIEQARNDIAKLNEDLKKATTEEEKEQLNIQIAKNKKEMDLYVNELTTRHLKFALTAAHYFRFLPMDFESLVSSASIGIYEAAQRFAPSKKTKHPFYQLRQTLDKTANLQRCSTRQTTKNPYPNNVASQ